MSLSMPLPEPPWRATKLAKDNWDLLGHLTAFLLSPLIPALLTNPFS